MDELTTERCVDLLDSLPMGHLGVIDGEDVYVSPISYVLIGNRICFRTGSGRRTSAIRATPRVCFEVSQIDESSGSWESVILWGPAREIEDDTEARTVITALFDKYRPMLGSQFNVGPGSRMFEPAVLMEIVIESMSGRSSGSFFSLPMRPGRL